MLKSHSFVHKRKNIFEVSTYQQRLILSLSVWMKLFRPPHRLLPVQPVKHGDSKLTNKNDFFMMSTRPPFGNNDEKDIL